MRTIAEIQNEIESTQDEVKQTADAGKESLLRERLWELENELAAAQESNLQEHVQANGYIMDSIKSGDFTMAELAYKPEYYDLQRNAVQKWALEQQEAYKSDLAEKTEELQTKADQLTKLLETADEQIKTLDSENTTLKQANFQLSLERADFEKKLANAVAQLQPTEVKEVVPLSAEEQEANLVSELMGNRTKVTNIRFKDETGIDRKMILANNALTGAEIEDYAIYAKARYEEITAEAAEKLRTDYANKKAEIEAQQADIPAIESPEPIAEVEKIPDAPEPVEEFRPEEEVQAGHTVAEGSPSEVGELAKEKNPVITLESLHARVSALEERLSPASDAIQAVA